MSALQTRVTKKTLQEQVENLKGDLQRSEELAGVYRTDYEDISKAHLELIDRATNLATRNVELDNAIASLNSTLSELLTERGERDKYIAILQKQIDFVLRVLDSIAAYEGNSSQVVKALAKSVLLEAEVVPS